MQEPQKANAANIVTGLRYSGYLDCHETEIIEKREIMYKTKMSPHNTKYLKIYTALPTSKEP